MSRNHIVDHGQGVKSFTGDDTHPLFNQGYRDGLQGRKPTSDDSLYMLGFDQGRDDDIYYEIQRDRFEGAEE